MKVRAGAAAVAMMPAIPCRRCWQCRHNLENACARKRLMGYAVDGGLAEYMLVPADAVEARCLFPAHVDLPRAAGPRRAAGLCGQRPAPVAGRGRRRRADHGAGPIGLFHLQLALLAGARAVIVSQRSPGRRVLAERLGATVTVDPTTDDLAVVAHDVSGGAGIDSAIICIGVPELINQALQLSRVGGRVNIFAGLKGEGWAQLEADLIHYKQILVTGSSDARRSDYETALHLLESGRVKTAEMITHRFPLSAVTDAFDTVTRREAIKVAIHP